MGNRGAKKSKKQKDPVLADRYSVCTAMRRGEDSRGEGRGEEEEGRKGERRRRGGKVRRGEERMGGEQRGNQCIDREHSSL